MISSRILDNIRVLRNGTGWPTIRWCTFLLSVTDITCSENMT